MALVLAEADEGGFREWLNKILNLAKDWIKNEVTAAIGAVIGALVGWLLGKVINFFAAVREDDIFTSVTVSEQLARLMPIWRQANSPQVRLVEGAWGHYKGWYD